MRIIAGTHRGRPILPPRDAPGEGPTRPIVDRVKESLFSRLMSLGMLEGPDQGGEPWRAVDIFAGTGSLGLEALSRGAEHVTFVERDRDAQDRLRQNLGDFGFQERATIVSGSAFTLTWLRGLGDAGVRLVFLDPPYAMMKDDADRRRLTTLLDELLPHLEDGGVVVLRTHEDDPPLEPKPQTYDGPMSFQYGSMTLHFYQRPLPEEPADEGEPDGEATPADHA